MKSLNMIEKVTKKTLLITHHLFGGSCAHDARGTKLQKSHRSGERLKTLKIGGCVTRTLVRHLKKEGVDQHG